MILYHGSTNIIEKPLFGKGNPHNDYGLGFYCTENLELAREWACSNLEFNGFVNKYEINLKDFKILNLEDNNYSILNWLAILLKNRLFETNSQIGLEAKKYLIDNFYIDVDKYDIIIGYRADDSYFSFAKDFINNTIFLEQLSKAMHLGNLGTQIVLKSKCAIENIKFKDFEMVDASIYYLKRSERDSKARMDYFNSRTEIITDAIYVLDIIRKGLKNGNKIIF